MYETLVSGRDFFAGGSVDCVEGEVEEEEEVESEEGLGRLGAGVCFLVSPEYQNNNKHKKESNQEVKVRKDISGKRLKRSLAGKHRLGLLLGSFALLR